MMVGRVAKFYSLNEPKLREAIKQLREKAQEYKTTADEYEAMLDSPKKEAER